MRAPLTSGRADARDDLALPEPPQDNRVLPALLHEAFPVDLRACFSSRALHGEDDVLDEHARDHDASATISNAMAVRDDDGLLRVRTQRAVGAAGLESAGEEGLGVYSEVGEGEYEVESEKHMTYKNLRRRRTREDGLPRDLPGYVYMRVKKRAGLGCDGSTIFTLGEDVVARVGCDHSEKEGGQEGTWRRTKRWRRAQAYTTRRRGGRWRCLASCRHLYRNVDDAAVCVCISSTPLHRYPAAHQNGTRINVLDDSKAYFGRGSNEAGMPRVVRTRFQRLPRRNIFLQPRKSKVVADAPQDLADRVESPVLRFASSCREDEGIRRPERRQEMRPARRRCVAESQNQPILIYPCGVTACIFLRRELASLFSAVSGVLTRDLLLLHAPSSFSLRN
ncbi:hypothetical protein C8J57DRAFT_1230934 [Mycena rebaudengoi]|nr:hypothetical protein C8J57DRAFT_1230934 [Mycena rebaudengoi]